MDPITAQALLGAAGAAADPIYVDDVFSTFLYDGNNGTQSINNGIDLSGEGGMVWLRKRNTDNDHYVGDTARGAGKVLLPNDNLGQLNWNANDTFKSFDSSGFTVGGNTGFNGPSDEMCSWTFRKCPGFFDVVTWNGDGTDRDISHNLGSIPGMIIVKRTDTSENWIVYHRSVTNGYLRLDDTSSVLSRTDYIFQNPTNTTFRVGSFSPTNASGGTYVAYVFAHDDQSFGTDGDEAIIKCGSFSASAGFPYTVNVGFEPQWVIIKRTATNIGDWTILDNMRGWVADMSSDGTIRLLANLRYAEDGVADMSGLTSTGFTVDDGGITYGSGQDYIYMAIRRPHKPPEAATECFDVFTQTGSNSDQLRPGTSGSSVTDLAWIKNITTTSRNWVTGARLTGNQSLFLNNANAARTDIFDSSPNPWDQMSGTELNGADSFEAINVANDSYVNYHFTRKPGFMDVVTYKGVSASDLTVSHNLGVVPELMIVYNMTESQGSAVYVEAIGNTKTMFINVHDDPEVRDCWNQTSPTATNFTLGNDSKVNNNGDNHVAYLFATLAGISKIGTYTGTGNDINIDCGFTAGARFILIKRTDANGDWYVFDSARGIYPGNDSSIVLNTDSSPVTNIDSIDPLNAGFTVKSSAPAGLNNSNGGTYMFLAIA